VLAAAVDGKLGELAVPAAAAAATTGAIAAALTADAPAAEAAAEVAGAEAAAEAPVGVRAAGTADVFPAVQVCLMRMELSVLVASGHRPL
jgi:hypothetical protein